jgi:hypothetical protein
MGRSARLYRLDASCRCRAGTSRSSPTSAGIESEKVNAWVQLIQNVEERHRLMEEKRVALEANLMAQEAQLSQLLSQLHQNVASLYDTLGLQDKACPVRKKPRPSTRPKRVEISLTTAASEYPFSVLMGGSVESQE